MNKTSFLQAANLELSRHQKLYDKKTLLANAANFDIVGAKVLNIIPGEEHDFLYGVILYEIHDPEITTEGMFKFHEPIDTMYCNMSIPPMIKPYMYLSNNDAGEWKPIKKMWMIIEPDDAKEKCVLWRCFHILVDNNVVCVQTRLNIRVSYDKVMDSLSGNHTNFLVELDDNAIIATFNNDAKELPNATE